MIDLHVNKQTITMKVPLEVSQPICGVGWPTAGQSSVNPWSGVKVTSVGNSFWKRGPAPVVAVDWLVDPADIMLAWGCCCCCGCWTIIALDGPEISPSQRKRAIKCQKKIKKSGETESHHRITRFISISACRDWRVERGDEERNINRPDRTRPAMGKCVDRRAIEKRTKQKTRNGKWRWEKRQLGNLASCNWLSIRSIGGAQHPLLYYPSV